MSDGYGKKIGKALEAIYQLYVDSSKLLSDCDTTVCNGMTSIFGTNVTKGLSKAYDQPDKWMPYCIWRYYDATGQGRGLVDGVMLDFWDDPPGPDEPTLVLARIKYRLDERARVKDVCEEWDLWYAAFEWQKSASAAGVFNLHDVGDGRIEWINLTLAPLYSIQTFEEVQRLMGLVRHTQQQVLA